CGARVTNCSSGTKCLELLVVRQPQVLIVDIGMPGTDGYSLIQTIRASGTDGGCDIPAIAFTAFARSEDRRRAMLAGFDIHVAKPVEPGELIAVVARLS